MRLMDRRTVIVPILVVMMALTGACVPENGGSGSTAPPPEFGPRGGLAPPPGRTEAERQARRSYYQGPRGDEF